MGKVVSREELKNIVKELKDRRKTIVTTNGAFDLFHSGHIKSLDFAKKHAEILVVGINSDSSIKQYKSEKRPIIPETQRAEIVSKIDVVDYVTIFEEKTPVKFLELINPDFHLKGSEYKTQTMPERETIEKNNGKIIFIERDVNDVSTSKIIKKILDIGDVK